MAFGFSEGGGGGAFSVIPSGLLHGSVLVPDTELLFTATFHRHGPDLLLVGRDGREHLIPGYFATEHHPALVAPNGAQLSAHTVDLLAGSPTPGQYAQAQPALPADAIGKVEKVVGDVSVMRNGVTVALHVGDALFKSDVVQTGASSSCGISFPDGTALNLVANTRMALNDYAFDANANSGNGALFSLVEGTFAFVAGKVAHTGDMKIATPVATMGIRGTTGVIGQADNQNLPPEIATITANAAGESYEFSVVPDFGTGRTGVYDLYDANGNAIATVSQSGYVTFVIPQLGQDALVRTVPADQHRIDLETGILSGLFSMINPTNQQNGGTNGSSTPPGPPPLNPIPQLLEQTPGSPINFIVPGNNATPPTTVTASILDVNGPLPVVIWTSGGGNFDQAPGWNDGLVPGAPTSAIQIPDGKGPVKVSDIHAVNGIEVDGTGTLIIAGGGYLEDLHYIRGNGTLVLNSTGDVSILAIDGPVTLSGGGTIKMIGTAVGNHIVGVPSTGAFLINLDYTITGTGTIGDGSGDLHFQNFGTVNATGLLIINTGNQLANNGLMEATAGTATDGSSFVGTLQIEDSLFNAVGATIKADGVGATVELSGSTVDNFNLISAQNGGIVAFTGVTVTNEAAATMNATGAGSILAFTLGALTNLGTLGAFDGGTLDLTNVTVTDSGAGALSIDAFSTFDLNNSSVLGGPIDNAGTAVVTGTSVLHGDTVTNEGTITVVGSDAGLTLQGDTALTNADTGVITADGGMVTVNLVEGEFVNSGQIIADDGGSVDFNGEADGSAVSNTNAIEALNSGTLQFDNVTVSNTGGEVSTDATSILDLNGSSIIGGAIDNAGNAVVTGASVLHGDTVTNESTMTVGSDASLTLQADTALTNAATGVITADGGALTINLITDDNVNSGQIVAVNGGTIDFDAHSGSDGAMSGSQVMLTNDAGAIVQATSGGTITYDAGGVTNNGAFQADNGGSIIFANSYVTNTGVIGAVGSQGEDSSGGTVQVNNTIVSNIGGTISAAGAGSSVQLADSTIKGGTLSTDNGGVVEVVATDGANTSVLEGGPAVVYSQVTVPGYEPQTEWNDTGIMLTAGEEIAISASGTISIGDDIEKDGQNVTFETPAGDPSLTTDLIAPDFLVQALVPWSLVGMIGDSTPFEVGSASTFIATSSGELYLSINDSYFGDNSGSWTASVTATQSPVINTGLLQVDVGANLELNGAIDNNGHIDVSSLDDQAANLLISSTVVLVGSGVVTLDGPSASIIGAGDSGGTLDNFNTITGAGFIGHDGPLTVINDAAGIIDADISGDTLTVDTGGNTVINAGLMEATNGGRLDIDSQLDNSNGALTVTSGSVLDAQAAVHGGNATIEGGTLQFDASSNVHVNFDNGPAASPTYGTLVLTDPEHFSGQISGFSGTEGDVGHSDAIDLVGIDYNSESFTESYDASKGVLTVSDGGDSASLSFINFSGTFDFASDGKGGTMITDPPATGSDTGTSSADADGNSGNNSNPNAHNSMAKMFNAPTGDHGGSAPSGPSTTPSGGANGDTFTFNSTLGDHPTTPAQQIDLSHVTPPVATTSFAPPMPELHPDFGPDPGLHLTIDAPNAMDQFHQTVVGFTLVH